MKMNHCYQGDCRDVMRQLIADGVRVQTIVTSPPYWNLRDYGVAGQIGMEPTLQEFVATMVGVFDLARELLADDGTLWLNLGDSYTSGGRTHERDPDAKNLSIGAGAKRIATPAGLKPKDLCGVPWRVALALQAPRYLGKIKNEVDRAWLAAIIDGEGCFFIHRRKAGASAHSSFTKSDGSVSNYTRTSDTYGVGLEICNTSKALINRVAEIVGGGTFTTQGPEENARRKQTIYRWRVAPNECKRIAAEVYPYLVAKQQQARLILGCSSSGEKAQAAYIAMMDLHRGRPTSVDFDAPEPMYGIGWYLRQEIIWGKPNPMPESVRDRCTKSHEQLFLLTKSPKYYFDQEAILEPCSPGTHARLSQDIQNQIGSERANGGAKTNGNMKAVSRGGVDQGCGQRQGPPGNEAKPRKVYPGTGVGFGRGTDAEQRGRGRVKNNESFDAAMAIMPAKRNKRSVWTIATQSYSEAHFATFPEALVEPCILAGSRPGDIVFDPFMGSGTVAQVAQNLGRKWIGSELNPKYITLQAGRTRQAGLEFAA